MSPTHCDTRRWTATTAPPPPIRECRLPRHFCRGLGRFGNGRREPQLLPLFFRGGGCAGLLIHFGGPLDFRGEAVERIAKRCFLFKVGLRGLILVCGGVEEVWNCVGALLHEKPDDGPVVLAFFYVIGKEHAVDYFVGARFAYRDLHFFLDPAVTGGINPVSLEGEVIPVVSYGLYAPTFRSEWVEVVESVLIEINLSALPVEADGFIFRKTKIHSNVRGEEAEHEGKEEEV